MFNLTGCQRNMNETNHKISVSLSADESLTLARVLGLKGRDPLCSAVCELALTSCRALSPYAFRALKAATAITFLGHSLGKYQASVPMYINKDVRTLLLCTENWKQPPCSKITVQYHKRTSHCR